MTDSFLPFAVPDVGEEEIAEVVHSLRSGWVTTGPKTRQFEAQFAAFLGDDLHAVAVNSATAGLHLALEAVGVQAGDEVIMTPYTFTASAEVVRYLGADPVFVDIDPRTLNIDPGQIERALTPKTRAIMPVHFGGLACDMASIYRQATAHGLSVIEDAAHAFPSTYGGRLVGALPSDAAVFSFYATKTITTGEGGMLVTRRPEIAERARVMRLHGISRDAFDRYTSRTPAWQYEVVAPGFKYNMSDLAASLGIAQLRKARRFLARRQELAHGYDLGLSGLPLKLPPAGPNPVEHAYHLYVVRLDDGAPMSRDRFIEAMADEGIGCSVHFIPLHLQPYWRKRYQLRPADFPESLHAYERAVSLPIHTRMTGNDQDRVIRTVRKLLAG